MTVFITGGSKSGKSELAQSMAAELAASGDIPLYYLATMEPHDDEDRARIARHIEGRADMGFITLECPRDILSCLDRADERGVFLLDSVTALLSNEMFSGGRVHHDAAEIIAAQLETLAGRVGGLVVVADSICCDCEEYDGLTESFRAGLGLIARRLAGICDRAFEVCARQAIDIKQGYGRKGESALATLIIGGAHQGKTDYAIWSMGLTKEEICVCGTDAEPDFSKRCLCHLERFARYCMKSGCDWRESLERWLAGHPNGVLICDDIFCGVVPTDRELRAWRETSGNMLGFAAERAHEVLRVVCGLPQRIK